jgi:hypothetical protein
LKKELFQELEGQCYPVLKLKVEIQTFTIIDPLFLARRQSHQNVAFLASLFSEAQNLPKIGGLNEITLFGAQFYFLLVYL